jgi:hypothetical protein
MLISLNEKAIDQVKSIILIATLLGLSLGRKMEGFNFSK